MERLGLESVKLTGRLHLTSSQTQIAKPSLPPSAGVSSLSPRQTAARAMIVLAEEEAGGGERTTLSPQLLTPNTNPRRNMHAGPLPWEWPRVHAPRRRRPREVHPTGVPHLQENVPPQDPTVGLCLGS